MDASRRYRAFISYSQTDMRAAQRLHRALEDYRVPLGISPDVISSDVSVLGRGKSRRLGRFFRDMDEMGAATDISATVRGAIEDSESLIVVCSPRSAQSRWVSSEVEHFKSTGRGDHVYAVIIDGEPNSGDPATECFPPGLRADFKSSAMPIEPLGIDLRRDSLNRACTRIAAGLLGVKFDDLWQRNRREERRRMLLTGGVVAGVVAVAAGIVTAVWSGQQREAGRLRSAQLAEAARVASDLGFFDRAARYAVAGLRGASDPLTGFDAKAAEVELRRALSGGLDFATTEAAADAMLPDSGPVFFSIQFSPDGKHLVAGTAAGEAALWDASTGKQLAILGEHEGAVRARFSPDGLKVFTLGQDGVGRLWDSATGKELAKLATGGGSFQEFAFNRDGTRIAISDDNQRVTVWDGAGRKLADLLQPDAVGQVMLTPDGGEVITVSALGQVRRWNISEGRVVGDWELGRDSSVEMNPSGDRLLALRGLAEELVLFDLSGKRVRSYRNVGHQISRTAFSNDGRRIAAGSFDGSVTIFDTATGRKTGNWFVDIEPVYHLEFSGDDTRLLTGTEFTPPVVWTLQGTSIATPAFAAGFTNGAVLSPDGRRVAVATEDGQVRVWSISREDEGLVLDARASQFPPTLSADGKRIAIPVGDGSVSVWSLENGGRLATFKYGDLVSHAVFNPDGSRLLTLSEDGAAAIWDIAGGKSVSRTSSDSGAGLALIWAGAGPRVLVYAADDVAMWDGAGAQAARMPDLTTAGIGFATFSADGSRIASFPIWTDGLEDTGAVARSEVTRVFDATTGKELTVLRGHGGPLLDMAFSPDGRLIATTSSDQTVRVWDAATGAQQRMFEGLPLAQGPPVFSRDSRMVALPMSDFAIRLMDVGAGSIQMLTGHVAHIRHIAFNQDGSLLASAAEDGEARVWDAASGREVARFRDGQGDVTFAGFTADERLVTITIDGKVRVRKLPTAIMNARDDLVMQSCSRLLQGGASRFSPQELKAAPVLDAVRDADACGR